MIEALIAVVALAVGFAVGYGIAKKKKIAGQIRGKRDEILAEIGISKNPSKDDIICIIKEKF